jgi:outer membrane lipoprotein-sorting protein
MIQMAKSVLICSLLILISALGASEDASVIIARSDSILRGEQRYSEMKMTVQRPRWNREVSMRTWTLGTKYSMVLITAPARERGQVFLKRGQEMWNRVPAIEREVLIPSSMMMQSWMGSDFTNDDLLQESSIVNDYHHELIGLDTLQGRLCWVIELKPKAEAAVVWGKVKFWISQNGYHQIRSEYYDEHDELVNYHQAVTIATMGGREIITKFEVVPAEKVGHKTILEILDIDFNPDLETSFFTLQNMRRLR